MASVVEAVFEVARQNLLDYLYYGICYYEYILLPPFFCVLYHIGFDSI